MGSFWASFFEQFKDCGRSGYIFVAALLSLIGLLVVCGIIYSSADFIARHADYFLPAGVGFVALVAIWIGKAFCGALARRRERLDKRPLSSDEARVARSKLKNGFNTVKSIKPMERPIDTDLRM